MTHADTPRGFRINGWHVLGLFVVFFAAIIGVDTLMIVEAYESYPGEATAQPYEEGLRWDAALDQQRAQAALGWTLTAGLDAAGDIRVTARDRSGAPVVFAHIDAKLERPATVQDMRTLRFVMTAPGVYVARPGALSGGWDLSLSAYDARGRRFDAQKRLYAP